MTMTLKALLVAVALSVVLGPLLGRIATQWFAGRGLSNLLTELRAALLPFLIVPLVVQGSELPPWIALGLVVGVSQSIAVSRWIARRSGEWVPALLGGIALGRSGAALLSARAQARGAVIGTLGITVVQLVALEALLALLFPTGGLSKSLGGSLVHGVSGSPLFVVLLLGTSISITEAFGNWAVKGKRRA